MKTIVIVFALAEEKQAFVEHLSPSESPTKLDQYSEEIIFQTLRLILVTTGVTMLQSYKLALTLEQIRPVEVINVGTCAGLHHHKIGEVIHAHTFYNYDLDLTMFGRSLGQLKVGMPDTITQPIIVSGSKFLQSDEEIKKVRMLFNADAYDMESYGYWIICQQYRVPFSAIRGVTDDGDKQAEQAHVNHLITATKKASDFTLDYLKDKYLNR